MITPKEYLMGRDKDYPLDMLQAMNMADLLARINWLISKLGFNATVTSGYRPSAINRTIGGAKMSTHTMCAGVDILDPGGKFGKLLKDNLKLLEECGLYLENPEFTVTKDGTRWVHLDTKKRKNTMFNP